MFVSPLARLEQTLYMQVEYTALVTLADLRLARPNSHEREARVSTESSYQFGCASELETCLRRAKGTSTVTNHLEGPMCKLFRCISGREWPFRICCLADKLEGKEAVHSSSRPSSIAL